MNRPSPQADNPDPAGTKVVPIPPRLTSLHVVRYTDRERGKMSLVVRHFEGSGGVACLEVTQVTGHLDDDQAAAYPPPPAGHPR